MTVCWVSRFIIYIYIYIYVCVCVCGSVCVCVCVLNQVLLKTIEHNLSFIVMFQVFVLFFLCPEPGGEEIDLPDSDTRKLTRIEKL